MTIYFIKGQEKVSITERENLKGQLESKVNRK